MSPPIATLDRQESDLRDAFWRHVSSFPDGHKIQTCLQCGTCTGACPVSHAMDITPREMIGLFRAGLLEDILQSRAVWICASCYSCTVRCPSDIRVTDTLYALKRLAMETNIYPDGFPVNRLASKFVDTVYKYGRNYELGLGFHYYLHTSPSKLPKSAAFGLSLMRKGRLGLRPKPIRQIKQVRAIMDRARESGGS
jgi:heterodisulfide reductase subunit C